MKKSSSRCFIMRSPYPTIKAPFVFPIFYLKLLVESVCSGQRGGMQGFLFTFVEQGGWVFESLGSYDDILMMQ